MLFFLTKLLKIIPIFVINVPDAIKQEKLASILKYFIFYCNFQKETKKKVCKYEN